MITVVIASYKYGHLAAHAIESLLSQTRKPDKIFLVDDGAGDCKHLKGIYPDVEYVFKEKNLGTVANFQDMLNRVKTDKCVFIGADNWLRSDALEILDKVDADIVTYDIQVTGELKEDILNRHPREVSKYKGDFWWDRSSGHHGSMLYNTKKAQEVGYHSEAQRTQEDRNLYHDMLSKGATRIHVSEPLLYYRRHRENFNSCK